jgi:hypothetical protein
MPKHKLSGCVDYFSHLLISSNLLSKEILRSKVKTKFS